MKSHTFLRTIGLVVALCAVLLGCDIPTLNNNLREPEINPNSPTSGTPGDVGSLSAVSGAGEVKLTWTNPTDADFDHTEITYNADNGPIQVVPSVSKDEQQITIGSLAGGAIYTFWVKLVDSGGSKSLGSVVVVSLAKVVTDLDLAQYVTAPLAGAARDEQPIEGPQYTGKVSWRKFISATNVSTYTGNFEVGIAYRAVVTLTPKAGYIFPGAGSNTFTYWGKAIAPDISGKIVNIDFPALDPVWYVASDGNDTSNGLTTAAALKTVGGNSGEAKGALKRIAEAHAATPLTGATIVVIGTSGDIKQITISNTDSIYPPITLRGMSGAQPGILTANKDSWTGDNRVLYAAYGANVTLGNDLTLTGGGMQGVSGGVSGAGVMVNHASTFTMNGGTITGNKNTVSSAYGGGVFIANSSTFTMNSGVISHNHGFFTGGVYIGGTGTTFTMNGGTITNNTAEGAGGGVRTMNKATATMNGGTISANSSETVGGGGLFIEDSLFTMNGGSITGNNVPTGGGGVSIKNDGIFIMNEGTITDNTAGEYGGGVELEIGTTGASFTMHGGIISGNTAEIAGGGMAVRAGTFKKQPLVSGGSSGIIYGNDSGANSNTVTTAAIIDLGHAVYVETGAKTRETTAGQWDHLDSGASSGWAE
jgi:hypothetical protein